MNPKTRKDGFSVVGLGVAACAACCAGPILAVLGGLSLAGLTSTWLIGRSGLAISAVAGLAYLAARRRRASSSCATAPSEPVAVALTERKVSP